MDGSEYGIISLVPIAILIVGVIITKKMTEMLIVSTFIGAILIFKQGFFSGYISLFYETMAGDMFQFLFLILIFVGALITLLEKSGAMMGFSDVVTKLANTPRKAMLITWILGIIVFIDDYLNNLAVGSCMRGITDKLGIPREHLAYMVNSTGACVCVILPFSTWGAFAIGCIGEFGLGFSNYVHSIPFMFYPWAAIIISLLLGLGFFPKLGPMKKAYERVANGGDVTVPPDPSGAVAVVSIEADPDTKPSSMWNFLIPMIVMIAGVIIFDNDIIHGLMLSLLCVFIMYLAQRIMTLTQFMNGFLEGITNMANLIFIVLIAFVLATENDKMGMSPYVIGVMSEHVSPAILPPMTFLICAFIAFTSGSLWALIAIATPVFVPLAQGMGIPPEMLIAGIMSGTALGSQICFYVDAVFMTAAATGVPNMVYVRHSAIYVIIGVVVATIAFAVAGFVAL